MVIDWGKIILRGGLVAALAGGGWYYVLGPGAHERDSADTSAINENAGPQTSNNWATAISPGPPNEAGQSLNFLVTGNDNPGLFSAGWDLPRISALDHGAMREYLDSYAEVKRRARAEAVARFDAARKDDPFLDFWFSPEARKRIAALVDKLTGKSSTASRPSLRPPSLSS